MRQLQRTHQPETAPGCAMGPLVHSVPGTNREGTHAFASSAGGDRSGREGAIRIAVSWRAVDPVQETDQPTLSEVRVVFVGAGPSLCPCSVCPDTLCRQLFSHKH